MNGTLAEAQALAGAIAAQSSTLPPHVKAVICPPFLHVSSVVAAVAGSSIAVGAQDCSVEAKGAFTGDISVPMLIDAGCSYVIVGHSERRHGKGETDQVIRQKATAALNAGLKPIICVGEILAEREANQAESVVAKQLEGSLPADCSEIIVAYEPVWAIGTGKVASPKDVQNMHQSIQKAVSQLRPHALLTILYGGSVNAENAAELLAIPEVGGALVGGASLKAESFLAIARAVKGEALAA